MLSESAIMLALLILNFLLSYCEAALLVLRGPDQEMAKGRAAKLLLKAGGGFENTVSVTSRAIFIVAGTLFALRLGTVWETLVSLLWIYLLIAVGVVLPRRLDTERVPAFVYALGYALHILLLPLTWLVSAPVALITGKGANIGRVNVTEDEIRRLVEDSQKSGLIDESEKEMINNVFEFNNVSVEDVATHRTDIIALSADASRQEIIDVMTREQFTRIPVYGENIDDIIGILHMRDFLNYILKPENYAREDINLRDILRKPYFVPISKKTDDLFEEMQKTKQHVAVVVDEYGGTAGIVTMEDIVEEIMGSILDEYDEEEKPELEQIDESSFIVNGTANLEEISEYFGIPLPFDDYDTISGFVIGQIGHIPQEDERPEFEFEGLSFKVMKVEEKRVAYVIVTKL